MICPTCDKSDNIAQHTESDCFNEISILAQNTDEANLALYTALATFNKKYPNNKIAIQTTLEDEEEY